MMGWFAKEKADTVERYVPEQEPALVVTAQDDGARFVEFEGAMAETDEDTGKLVFFPRGSIHINVLQIGGFYDHTILLFGNKIRVMETEAQIYMKIKGAAE